MLKRLVVILERLTAPGGVSSSWQLELKGIYTDLNLLKLQGCKVRIKHSSFQPEDPDNEGTAIYFSNSK